MAYDLIILGGDSVARAAARAATRRGLWTALVEPDAGQLPYATAFKNDLRSWLVDEYRGQPQFRGPREVEFHDGRQWQALSAARILVATGTRADSLKLHRAGLFADEHGQLWCDHEGRTWTDSVFAVGAVVGFPSELQTPPDLDEFIRTLADVHAEAFVSVPRRSYRTRRAVAIKPAFV